jgi:hypothetical protein
VNTYYFYMQTKFLYRACHLSGKLIKKVESSILTDNRTAILRLSAAPRYMVLSTFIDQVRFQCYANGQPAKHGQTVWTRGDEIVPCNTSNRVFACVNIIVITHVSAQDAGKYKCLSKDNHLNSYTVSILGKRSTDEIIFSKMKYLWICCSPS